MRQPERDDFKARLADVEQKYGELTRCPAVIPVGEDKPPQEPGVYAFFIEDQPCYVGRTKNLRRRIQQHRLGNGKTGHLPATIARQKGISIDAATPRVKAMKVSWVVVAEAEDHGVRQALLELYAAVQLPTLGRYNERLVEAPGRRSPSSERMPPQPRTATNEAPVREVGRLPRLEPRRPAGRSRIGIEHVKRTTVGAAFTR